MRSGGLGSAPRYSQQLFLRINPSKFHFLKFILEGYDNLAILSVYDRQQGIVKLRFASSEISQIIALLADLAGQISSPPGQPE